MLLGGLCADEGDGSTVGRDHAGVRILIDGHARRRLHGETDTALAAAAWFLPPGRSFGGGEGRVRLTMQPPPGVTVDENANASVISPDGRTIAFVGTDSTETGRLW